MMQVTNTSPKTLAGAVELAISALTPEDEDCGWTLESTSIHVPNGESRPLRIGLKPSQALPDALKVCTGAQHKELRLSAVAQGEEVSYAITVHAVVK
ncbi:MAG: hypothetical protein HC767_02180 [Akkermansiaceae bacterium]|nr:hypothetical protein [Akkermansiaceae bacterium]